VQRKKDLLFSSIINYLILKAFNLSITNTFFVDIIIIKVDLVKYIIRDNKIIKVGNMIKEIIRINYYRCLSSLITPYKVKVVAYYFHSIKILTKYTNLNMIITINEKLYNLITIGVYITIDFNPEA
jgi:hypothetical protein